MRLTDEAPFRVSSRLLPSCHTIFARYRVFCNRLVRLYRRSAVYLDIERPRSDDHLIARGAMLV